MIVKIVTDCHFAGCETTHYVELEDGMTEEEIQEYADEIMQQDIEPQVMWERVDEDEADDMGYDIE